MNQRKSKPAAETMSSIVNVDIILAGGLPTVDEVKYLLINQDIQLSDNAYHDITFLCCPRWSYSVDHRKHTVALPSFAGCTLYRICCALKSFLQFVTRRVNIDLLLLLRFPEFILIMCSLRRHGSRRLRLSWATCRPATFLLCIAVATQRVGH